MKELSSEQQYFIDTAWEELRTAWKMHEQGRRARAQHHLQEARYFAVKVPGWFTDHELEENINRLGKTIAWGH